MADITIPTGKPPGSLNATVKLFLRTPGVQKLLGKHLALLTFTGRRSGTRYTIPISYERGGDAVLMLTKKLRVWWRNLQNGASVELRLAGETLKGTARAHPGTNTDVNEVAAFLEKRPQDAKAYGLTVDSDGRLDPEQIGQLLPHLVLVRVDLS